MRRYGLLLHISSLPSAWGIGDLGPAAHAFASLLASAGASVWQFLPLNPTSTFIGNSPYSSPSGFAGNPLFISPEFLLRDGYLSYGDLDSSFERISGGLCRDLSRVDFAAVSEHRAHLLHLVFEHNRHGLEHHADYQTFCREQAFWLHDHARFVSMKEAFDGALWSLWPKDLARRNPDALEIWDEQARLSMEREKFTQYLFFSQWLELREACGREGVALLGDVPLYVTHDSADVWANPGYFNLDKDMRPVTVSGVPPDYFSPEGQRWGNPIYKWDALEEDDFSWWKQRLGHSLYMADMVRLDHFRGFCGYWEIPAEEEKAINGAWKAAPAQALFTSLKRHFGKGPFLAEDLGVITPDVREIMREFELPGMHVLQFAFDGEEFADNPDIPHAHRAASVIYTGTHDNTPVRDWFANAEQLERDNVSLYAGVPLTQKNAAMELVRMAFASVAECAVIPVQDALNLGGEARMNIPGTARDNWTWRLRPGQVQGDSLAWLKEFARIYGRMEPRKAKAFSA